MAWAKFGLQPNAEVVESVDAAGFYAVLQSLLSVPTEPTVPIAGLD